ncbi:MAG TPA: hypothetical protein VHF22_05725, partial [Planctomycetota bacterium]|nr:hypothetical protein [Planctomycetota bacterium]
LDVEATLGALVRRAAAIELVDPAGRVVAAIRGEPRAVPAKSLPRYAGPGFVFFTPGATTADASVGFVPAPTGDEQKPLRERIEQLAGTPSRRTIAAGLKSFLPRIATDAAIDLLALGGEPDAAERLLVEDVLSGDLGRFEDLRPLVRLAARARCGGALGRVLDLVAAGGDADLTDPAAALVDALEARATLLTRLAGAPDDGARTRLARVFVALRSASVSELGELLRDRDEAVARDAAVALLRRGEDGRTRLLSAASRLEGSRRAFVEDLRRRPRLR